MSAYLLDANVVLRFLTKDNLPMWRGAHALFEKAKKGEVTLELDTAILAEVILTLACSGGGRIVRLSGTLQAAGAVNGTFTDVAGAISPYTAPTAGPAQFFRGNVGSPASIHNFSKFEDSSGPTSYPSSRKRWSL